MASARLPWLDFRARGCSCKEVAASFQISQSTVKNHLSNIYEKLEVHNIAGAIAIPQASETLIEQFKEFISTPKSAAHL